MLEAFANLLNSILKSYIIITTLLALVSLFNKQFFLYTNCQFTFYNFFYDKTLKNIHIPIQMSPHSYPAYHQSKGNFVVELSSSRTAIISFGSNSFQTMLTCRQQLKCIVTAKHKFYTFNYSIKFYADFERKWNFCAYWRCG